MSVYKRNSDSLWVVSWYVGGKKKTKTFKSEQVARDYETERLLSLSEVEDRITFGELVVCFFKAHPDYHHKTKSNVFYALTGREEKNKHIEGPAEFLWDKYADSLSRRDLENMRESFRITKSANNTINKYQAYLRAILSWGADQELIHRNPWRDFKRLQATKKEVIVSLHDIRRIYDHAEPWLQWAMVTAYALSLRPGHKELFSLLWSSFNFDRGIATIRQGKSGRIKTVFLPQAYKKTAYARYIEDMKHGIPLVCHKAGRAITDYRHAWGTAVKNACVPHMPMYAIRHASASEMLAQGADLAAVAAQLGHSNVSTTGATYAHTSPDSQRRAANAMPELDSSK